MSAYNVLLRFQSTLPARGATRSRRTRSSASENFNPRSLHGERPDVQALLRAFLCISIHAPCTGSDLPTCVAVSSATPFQSTLPARGATLSDWLLLQSNIISIHAPCTGSDQASHLKTVTAEISIHAPCTGSDQAGEPAAEQSGISIHAPCTGSDSGALLCVLASGISIHAPCTGSDKIAMYCRDMIGISIHAPCTGSDAGCGSPRRKRWHFNPRSLHGERRSRVPALQVWM